MSKILLIIHNLLFKQMKKGYKFCAQFQNIKMGLFTSVLCTINLLFMENIYFLILYGLYWGINESLGRQIIIIWIIGF